MVEDQSEAHMARGAIERDDGPRRDAVAVAIAGVAQIGAPFGDPLRTVAGRPFIVAPFPYVSAHVEQARAVGVERVDRTGRTPAIRRPIDKWKFALPDVAGTEFCIVRFTVAPMKERID